MTEQEWYNKLEMRHGKELQQKFSSACIAVCGLGGLGSNVAISLARAGIGKLMLIDFDKVDISNLHRQQYSVSQLGMYKIEAIKHILSEITPYCNVITHTVKLTDENLSLLADCNIVCECFDNAEYKAMLVNGISENYPEKYIVAASGMSGLHTGNTIQTKKCGKRLYICGDGMSDVADNGTLFAPRVMLCAAHQANTVLRIIAGKFEV
ncbi:MAG: sulfur carrier protein ThiS adenylyltransferase ThiF [Oscillospiraceae bacterium]|nr:sulfur carrier protein ThiS adenylyltransferase ThiF [Oscillospiraceae bacterium]MBQ8782061.1 sulfur carrier protein ThiS adenylyltransferase ThiF [Oscillospiraceae bacterium]